MPKELRADTKDSYLKQYARIFNSVEIDSSFYRHHQHKTYARWAATVPESFRFSVKLPRSITHTTQPFADVLERFFGEVQGLGTKLEVLLLQFPPKKKFDRGAFADLLVAIRRVFLKKIVCEPRHESWFEPQALKLFSHYSVSTVIADPKAVPEAPEIFPTSESAYFRLHGAPRMYNSDYSAEFLTRLRGLPSLQSEDTWVIFDNTALGHAFRNAKVIMNDKQEA